MHAAVDIQATHFDSTLPTMGSGKESRKDALHHLCSKERARAREQSVFAFYLGCSTLPRGIAACGQEQ